MKDSKISLLLLIGSDHLSSMYIKDVIYQSNASSGRFKYHKLSDKDNASIL